MNVHDNNTKPILFGIARKRAKQNDVNQKALSQASPMKHQVGGISDTKKRILSIKITKTPNNYEENLLFLLFKPLQNNNRGLREIAFYEIVQASKRIGIGSLKATTTTNTFASRQSIYEYSLFIICRYTRRQLYNEIKSLCQLSEFVVDYHGVVRSQGFDDDDDKTKMYLQDKKIVSSDLSSYIILTDETKNFDKPCIIDLKIGTFTFEPDAELSKKESQRKKYPQQEEFGFRLVGMKVYDPHHDDACDLGYRKITKEDGRSLITRSSIKQKLEAFLKVCNINYIHERRKINVDMLYRKLMSLRKWFQENHSFAFYATSLLLIYEGAEDLPTSNTKVPVVKMIDFAHVRKHGGGQDEGYLHGLDNIISIFREILRGG